ncbi:MAG: hypothetical protein J0H74_16100 [Chitinophagaceae bacterium]|nr:hypothetical protein [Chitinophagaceae bacterium]
MKKYLFFGVMGLLFSCGKSSSGPSSGNGKGNSNWSLSNYTYQRGASSQNPGGNFVSMAVSTSGNGGNYGAYSGSSLTILFNNLGPGKYTLASEDTLVKYLGTKFITIDCTVGIAVNTGAVMYSTTGQLPSATVDVSKDPDGKYHVTIKDSVTLIKNIVTGGGIPGAASSYKLEINNAF